MTTALDFRPATVDLVARPGTDLAWRVTLRDGDGNLVPLAGTTIEVGVGELTVGQSVPGPGVIDLTLTDTQTTTLGVRTWPWSLSVTDSGETTDYITGRYVGSMSGNTSTGLEVTITGAASGVDVVVQGGSVAAHEADPTAAHAASAVAFTPSGTVAATNVQAAIVEAATDAAAALTGHVTNPTGAHAATAVAFTPAGTIAATTVQAAVLEAATDAAAALTAHTTAATAAHAASAVAFTPAGAIAATDAQAAIVEVAADAAAALAAAFAGWDIITPEMFGAKGDGVTDDNVALQAWLDATHTTGNPISTTRIAIKAGYLPTKTYITSLPLDYTSVIGPNIYGAGRQSIIQAAEGVNMVNVLNINGCRTGLFSQFQLRGPNNTGKVDAVLDFYWDSTKAQRSTSGCLFSDVVIGGRFVTGFGVSRLSNGAKQVDDSRFIGIDIQGAGMADATLWQQAFLWGSGSSGNQTNYTVNRTALGQCKYGMKFNNIKCIIVTDLDCGSCDTVFYSNQLFGYGSFHGIECETDLRLWDGSGAYSSPSYIEFSSVNFDTANMANDGEWIRHFGPGTLILRGVRPQHVPPAAWTGSDHLKIVLSNAAGRLTCISDGGAGFDGPDVSFSLPGTLAEVIVTGFDTIDRSTLLITAKTAGPLHIGGVATYVGLEERFKGDTGSRWNTQANGVHNFGSGTGATDTTLSRLAAGKLGVGTSKIVVADEKSAPWVPGRWVDPAGADSGRTGNIPGEGTLLFVPLYLEAKAISDLGVFIVTAGTTGALARLGLYTDVSGAPGVLCVDGGTVAAETVTTFVSVAAPFTPPVAGWYWGCGGVQGGAGTRPGWARLGSINTRGAVQPAGTLPNGFGIGCWTSTASTFTGALPASAPAVSRGAGPSCPVIYYKWA